MHCGVIFGTALGLDKVSSTASFLIILGFRTELGVKGSSRYYGLFDFLIKGVDKVHVTQQKGILEEPEGEQLRHERHLLRGEGLDDHFAEDFADLEVASLDSVQKRLRAFVSFVVLQGLGELFLTERFHIEINNKESVAETERNRALALKRLFRSVEQRDYSPLQLRHLRHQLDVFRPFSFQ